MSERTAETGNNSGAQAESKKPSRLTRLTKAIKEPNANKARKSELLSAWAEKRDIVNGLNEQLEAAKLEEQKVIEMIAHTIGAGPWRFDGNLVGLAGRDETIYMRVWGNEDVEQLARVKPTPGPHAPKK